MKLLTLSLDAIEVADRLRAVDEAHARWIAESFGEIGQISPIEVRPIGGAAGDGRYALVSGAHRLRAAAIAGMTTIAAVVFEGAAAQVREIDENLRRYDLNVLDRAAFLALRQQIYDEQNPTTGRGGDRKSLRYRTASFAIRFSSSFTADAAAKLGYSDRSIRQSIWRWKLVSRMPASLRARLSVSAVAETARELDAFLRLAAEDQPPVLALMELPAAERPKDVAEALRRHRRQPPAPKKSVMEAFVALWHRAGAEDRAAIRDFIAHDGNLRARRAAGTAAA